MINPKIQFTKIKEVKSPNRANMNDAGTDFYIPENTIEFETNFELTNGENDQCLFQDGIITIFPHCKVIIPGGIKVNILDKNTYLDVANKGGVATKQCLVKLAHVIDADFQGEIFFSLHNMSNNLVRVKCGQKIVQLIQKEYIRTEWEEISNEEYYKIEKTDRGEGQQGSSGLI